MNTNQTTISVVIPLYNKEEHITNTLLSVAKQHSPVKEIIVVNDGSTDNGAHVVETACNKHPELRIVKLVSQKNAGVSAARNKGIEVATGTHIAFLDADDIWLPDYTTTILNLIKTFPEARAQATAYYKRQNAVNLYPKIRMNIRKGRNLLINNYFAIAARGDLPFFTSSICIEKNLLQNLGGFPINEPMGEDQDVWARVSLKTPIAYSDEPLSVYELDADNRACNRIVSREECPFSRRLYKNVISHQIPQHLHTDVLRYTATHLIHIADILVKNHEMADAKRLMADWRMRLLPIKYARLVLNFCIASLKSRCKNLTPTFS